VRLDTFLTQAGERHPALVFQVSWANGLDIIRDLSAEDVPLLALDANPRALGLRSRLAAGTVCPDPAQDEEAFVSFLEDLGRRLPRKGVLFPTHDQYIWPISRHAERLEPYYLIPFSRWETMQRLHDKRAQMEAAWRVGVDTPKTVFVDSAADLERGVEEIGFPCIFKPVESLAFKTRFRRHVLEIGSADELRETYAKVDDCGTLMLQDIVPGGDEELYTLGSYLDAQSRALAVFTGHKLRQHPPQFGHVSMAVSKWVPELAEAGLRLLNELGYHGVSQVEFKRDPRDGRYRLMEVNARHWMWHSLGTACGVNLSLAAYRDAIGEPYISARQVDGLKWVVSLTDARDAFSRWRRGEEKFLPWLKSYRGVRVDGLYSLRDPFPGALLTARQLKNIVTRGGKPAEGESL
jgi:D-aspartate ligase